jgi:methionyl-tRNA synthetase
MTNRFGAATVPAAEVTEEPEKELHDLWAKTVAEALPLCEGLQFHSALERTFTFIKAINAYIEKRAPWKLGKSTEAADQARLRTSLATMAEALRLSSTMLQAVMPGTTKKIHAALGYTPGAVWSDELTWGGRLTGAKVQQGLVLFPRPQPAAGAPAKKA